MKKSSLNFLRQKSPNLFDTGVQMKHYDNVEFMFDPAVIPESGTAKVRSRPTVKHFSTSGDGALGFAVPTPKVPVLPPLNGLQSLKGSTEKLANGSMISVADPEEGEILIPPPPSVAPPPPPPKFIPPPPEFFVDLDPSVDLAALQPPSMPPPEPPSLIGSTVSEELDLTSLKPPPTATPKPPSNATTHAASAQDIPECPKFTPPLPPLEKPQSPLPKAQKTPPPKPVRLSSVYSFELPQAPTPAATPASSFNPQTTAKLYSVPKTTVLSSQADRETRAQHILLLEDSSGNPVGVHINGKAPSSIKEVTPAQDLLPPAKPVRRNSSGVQLEQDVHNLQETLPIEQRPINGEPETAVRSEKVQNVSPTPVKGSPKIERVSAIPSVQVVSETKQQEVSPGKTRSYSPLLNSKLQTLRGHEGSSGKETATSPLALLMAAKEREKQRSVVSRQSSNKSSSSAESLNVSVHPNETKPNSFTIIPVTASSASFPEPKLAIQTESQPKPQSQKISTQGHSTNSQTAHNCSLVKNPSDPTSASPPRQEEHSESAIPFIPPPPEFANSDSEDEAPPSAPPPDPPAKYIAQSVKSITIPNVPNTSPTAVTATEPKLKQVAQIQSQAPPGQQPPVKVSFPPLTLSQTSPSAQSKSQLPGPIPVQPKYPASLTTQPKTQIPASPANHPPATPPSQNNPQIPAPPTNQPPAPPPSQPKIQIPAPPSTQPPAPPTQPKTQIPSPPTTQPPAPPTQPKTQISTPPPTQPKTQIPTPPPTQPKTQIPAPPPTQPKTQIPAPPPTQPKTLIQTPIPTQPKTQIQTPPSMQPKAQFPSQAPPSVSASHATLLSILQKKMLEMDPKFPLSRDVDSSGDDWNSPLSDDDAATSPPQKITPTPKSAGLPMQTQGLDMKELETRVAKKAQDLAAKAPSNSTHAKQQYGMTFTVRPGTKQPITPVIKTD